MNSKSLKPVVFVPGYLCTKLYYQELNSNQTKLLWLSLTSFLFRTKDVCNKLSLIYDKKTGETYEKDPNIKVIVPKVGPTTDIENLTNFKWLKLANYFKPVIDLLCKNPFYVRDYTVRGAGYDFRRTPKENKNFIPDLKKIIEETYVNGNNQRIVLVAHSMGNLVSLYFFQQMEQEWLDKYIDTYIGLAGPWAGSTVCLTEETIGNSPVPFISTKTLKPTEESFPTTAWILPKKEGFQNHDLVITPSKNYSIKDYRELFQDLKKPILYDMYEDCEKMNMKIMRPPIKNVFCLYGNGHKTVDKLIFNSDLPTDEKPKQTYCDGDKAIPFCSLNISSSWSNTTNIVIPGCQHRQIVSHKVFYDVLLNVINYN